MINIDNFDKIKERYQQYWNMENHDRPLMDITTLKYDYRKQMPSYAGSNSQRWNDIEYVIQRERKMFEATMFKGEAYPSTYPNLGPDIFGAYFGCEIEFGEDTSWAVNNIDDICDIREIKVDWNNKWLKKTLEMTEAMLEDSKGDYIVGITDIHPGMDGLVSLRGPEGLCFDLYEEPDMVKALNEQMFQGFKTIYNRLNTLIGKYQIGNTNWMGVYHPESWYVTSCDFMGMISEDMFHEFIKGEIRGEAAFLQNTIFHLDGPGALRLLDDLLEIEEINGIQWVYGAGQPTAAYWLEVLKKIQNAGKMIHIDIVQEDLPILLEHLKPEGVLYRMKCKDESEAEYMMKLADQSYRKKTF